MTRMAISILMAALLTVSCGGGKTPEKGFEPLHAYYAKAVTPLLEDAILHGRYRIRRAVAACRIAYVPFGTAELYAFRNVNTPGDLDITACSAASSAAFCSRTDRARQGR